MKTLAICSPHFKEQYDLHKFKICGKEVLLSLINYPEKIDFDNIPENGVLVEVKAFSCNYRDKGLLLAFNDACTHDSNREQLVFSPFGSEFVAEVLGVGKSVTNLKKGDRVIPDATYIYRENKDVLPGLPSNFASQRVLLFDKEQLMKIPDCMPDEKAAAFTIAGHTVYSMIRRLSLKAGESVLVTSATSNTSLAAIIALRNQNVLVYAMTSSMENEARLLELGVHKVIPLSALNNEQMVEYIGNTKFEAVIDPFFDLHFCRLVNHMSFGSRYISCGLYSQSSSFPNLENPSSNSHFIKAFITCTTFNISFMGNCLGLKSDLEHAIEDFSTNKYDVIIDSIYTDNDIIPFLEKTFHKKKRFGKVVYKY